MAEVEREGGGEHARLGLGGSIYRRGRLGGEGVSSWEGRTSPGVLGGEVATGGGSAAHGGRRGALPRGLGRVASGGKAS